MIRACRLPRVVLAAILAVGLACPAWALQRAIRSKGHTYDHAPVLIQGSSVTLIETFFTPTQIPIAGTRVKQTRVRYANRAGLTPSSFVLKGEVICRNRSGKTIEALELSVVLLDAFHQPMLAPGQAEPVIVHRVTSSVPVRGESRMEWDQQVGSLDIYEVAVVVTRVRFADGSLWEAPPEELIDAF